MTPGHHDETGVTLIELLLSIVIMGFIASGVVAAIILFFRTADGTSTRQSLSHDSQLLATYLVPDLDSLTSGGPTAIPPSLGVNSCSPGFSAFQDIHLQFTDASRGQIYQVDYQVNGTSLTRTFGPLLQPPTTTTTVIHYLKPGGACFGNPPSSPWTMDITVEANGDPTTDYTFSVTGGGRVTSPPPPPPPIFVSAVSKATNSDGKVDEIVVTFSEPLDVNDTAATSLWTVSGLPAGVTLSSVSLSGVTAVLLLNQGTLDVDSLHLTVGLAQAANGNGIRNGANQQASFPPAAVSDGVAAVPTSIVSGDSDGDGIDQLVVTFSKTLCTAGPLCPNQPSTRPWQLVNAPSGFALSHDAPTVSANTVILPLREVAPADTSATGLRVALLLDPLGVIDADGNVSSFAAMPVSDGAPPVPVSIVSRDTDADGKVDQVVVTFSEPLVTTGATKGQWSLQGEPPGVSLTSVSFSGIPVTTVTLALDGATSYDTAAPGFMVTLVADPNGKGLQDASGNQSFFQLPVHDGMGPVVVGIASTNAAGGTPNAMDPGDTLTLTFSEPLDATSLPANPTVTLSPGTGGGGADSLTIAEAGKGVATVDLGSSHNSSVVTFAASLTVSGPTVTIVLVSQTGGPPGLTPGPNIVVTPAATVADGAGNFAVGRLSAARGLF